ncbi:hypothetical protein Nepgr_031776 [Nepenthes gracilis]|uniref:Uncharacterized protein n=1 Tax=Nepenthes gracilis TaxID=150966 RepID=A0AAD3TJA6_NEPGR|nr:hypothetical protein Nepgr_031776 [Nepenthes gracilis]
MPPRNGSSHLVMYSISKLAPVAADEVPVVAIPKLAPCPEGKDKVGKDNDAPLPYLAPYTLSTPLDNMHQINHYPQGGLGVDGNKPVSVLSNVDGNIASFAEFIKHGANENKPVCVVPLFIQDPASPVLAENHQLDDMHLADAVIDESLAADSSPSPHAAPADQYGKAPGSAQLALSKNGDLSRIDILLLKFAAVFLSLAFARGGLSALSCFESYQYPSSLMNSHAMRVMCWVVVYPMQNFLGVCWRFCLPTVAADVWVAED